MILRDDLFPEVCMRTAVIGVGMMGSRYANMLLEGKINGLELCALTRVKEEFRKKLPNDFPIYQSADALFDAIEAEKEQIDAVIIATPHYSHEAIALRAFRNHIHVLCDKPAGVYSRQAANMEAAAEQYHCSYGMIFHQRTFPVYQKLHELVQSGIYGSIKRVSWTVTDWYRTQAYYDAGSWRATWDGEGGGLLINQAPHNLDLLQWICGMPECVHAFCHEGKYHDIEVEDDVTMYMEWASGATGTFISSTGEVPGINRLEIMMEDAKIVCEKGVLKIGELVQELGMKESEYRRTSPNGFARAGGTWKTLEFEKPENPYLIVLQAFSDEINGTGKNIVPGSEGRNSLLIANAAYLSSWTDQTVKLPGKNTEEEREFEKQFEMHLEQKRRAGKTK